MSNFGRLSLTILDVAGRPAVDSGVRIDVLRTNGVRIARFGDLPLPLPGPLELPAFPQESNLKCDVTPRRYRGFYTPFFTLSEGTPKTLEASVFKLPKKWTANFTRWADLDDTFERIKDVLTDSDIKVIKGEKLGRFTEDKYDSVSSAKSLMAKASLLNLFAKLTVLEAPETDGAPWFSFVETILAIDRERFYAVVDPEIFPIVEAIRADPEPFEIYENTPAQNHFEKLQETLPEFRIFKTKMISIKTTDAHGNLQITLAPAKDAGGAEVLLLDSDLDENGKLFNHLIDAFLIHPFSGGTHPFDIHEYMRIAHPQRLLGYVLI